MNRQDSASSRQPFFAAAPVGDSEDGTERQGPRATSPCPPSRSSPTHPSHRASVITSNGVVDIQALSGRVLSPSLEKEQRRPRQQHQHPPRPMVGDSSRDFEDSYRRPHQSRPPLKSASQQHSNLEEEGPVSAQRQAPRRPRFAPDHEPRTDGKLVNDKIPPKNTTRLVVGSSMGTATTGTATTALASSLSSSTSSGPSTPSTLSAPSTASEPSTSAMPSPPSGLEDAEDKMMTMTKKTTKKNRRSLLRPPSPTTTLMAAPAGGFLHQSTNTVTTTTTTTRTEMAHNHHYTDPSSQDYNAHYHGHHEDHHQQYHEEHHQQQQLHHHGPPLVAGTAFDQVAQPQQEAVVTRPQVHFHFHLHTDGGGGGGDEGDETGGRIVNPGNLELLESTEMQQIQHLLQSGLGYQQPALPPAVPHEDDAGILQAEEAVTPSDHRHGPPPPPPHRHRNQRHQDDASMSVDPSLAGLTSEIPEYLHDYDHDYGSVRAPREEPSLLARSHHDRLDYCNEPPQERSPHAPSDRFLPVIVARNTEVSVTGAEWGGSIGGAGVGSLQYFGESRQSLSTLGASTLGAGSSVGFTGADARQAWNAGGTSPRWQPPPPPPNDIPTTVSAGRREPELPGLVGDSPKGKSSSFPFSVVRGLKRPTVYLDPKKLWQGSHNNYYRHRSSTRSEPVESSPRREEAVSSPRTTPLSTIRKMVTKRR